jgi:FkbM family methyltransferase
MIKKLIYFYNKIQFLYVLKIKKSAPLSFRNYKALKFIPRYTKGEACFESGIIITYVDSLSLFYMYEEIFIREIYKFFSHCSSPFIIDAGANIGLSIIYFKKLFPYSEIVAFEPDKVIFEILQNNISAFNFKHVNIHNKALWTCDSSLNFMSEGADGGRIAINSDSENIVVVETVALNSFLNRRVDLLKIDIEGAETEVLTQCADLLTNVDRIFVEFHSFVTVAQELNKLLLVLSNAGFRYYIQHIGVYSSNPFIKVNYSLGMDNQLNIFAYRV